MDNISKITEVALTKYFNELTVLGYKNYTDVNRLILLTFIEELLTGAFSLYINERDYMSITNALYCIMGNNSLIKLPSYNNWDSLRYTNDTPLYRSTEYDMYRVTNDEDLRLEV